MPAPTHRYYPLFGLMANVALVLSGQYVQYVSGLRTATTGSSGEAVTTTGILMFVVKLSLIWRTNCQQHSPRPCTDPWAQSLQLLMAAVVAGGVAVIGLRAYMEQQVRIACREHLSVLTTHEFDHFIS